MVAQSLDTSAGVWAALNQCDKKTVEFPRSVRSQQAQDANCTCARTAVHCDVVRAMQSGNSGADNDISTEAVLAIIGRLEFACDTSQDKTKLSCC